MKAREADAVNCYRSVAAMGTRFDVLLSGADEEHLEAVASAVLEEIVRLDQVLSRFDPRSEIARINREASHKPVRVDREVFALLERCEQARRLTDGYFDVTAASGGNGLKLTAERSTVQFTRPDVVIDLGGIGKGYALDCGREICLRFGVNCGLLHGGTSSVLSLGAPGEGWLIAVRHPLLLEAAPVASIKLSEQSLSCSAVRHLEQAQSDVLNPLTGEPLSGSAACVVVAANATEAEIFSTALLAMGREQAKAYLAKMDLANIQVGWVEPDEAIVWIAST